MQERDLLNQCLGPQAASVGPRCKLRYTVGRFRYPISCLRTLHKEPGRVNKPARRSIFTDTYVRTPTSSLDLYPFPANRNHHMFIRQNDSFEILRPLPSPPPPFESVTALVVDISGWQ